MTMPLLRRLVPADAAVYRGLMLQAYAAEPQAFTSSAQERAALPLAWWGGRLAEGVAPAEWVCGAWQGEALVGVAGLSAEQRERTRHKAQLFGMYVVPGARGLGLGRALVAAVLAEAQTRPALELVQLTVSAGNAAAQALYQGCGFVAFGTEPRAVRLGGTYVDKVHMWRPLR